MATTSDRIIVFAGTTEGKEVASFLHEKGWLDRADFCVATEYGETTFLDLFGVHIITGRMEREEMQEVLPKYRAVIDATHPYAAIVTKNLQDITEKFQLPYWRLLRAESGEKAFSKDGADRVYRVPSTEAAARLLNEMEGHFLLTTGAKELGIFSTVRDFASRAAARVLPSEASLEACRNAGLASSRIIAMQGPFTKEMNLATMHQYDLSILVTKSSGKAGGFEEKAKLAEDGYQVIIIDRPSEEEGLDIAALKAKLEELWK